MTHSEYVELEKIGLIPIRDEKNRVGSGRPNAESFADSRFKNVTNPKFCVCLRPDICQFLVILTGKVIVR